MRHFFVVRDDNTHNGEAMWLTYLTSGTKPPMQSGSGRLALFHAGSTDRKLRFVGDDSVEKIVVFKNTLGAIDESGSKMTLDELVLPQISAPTTSDGHLWHDSGRNDYVRRVSGIDTYFTGVVFAQTGIKTVVSTATETTLFGTGTGTVTMPADWFVSGRSARITMRGVLSTKASGAGTLQIRVKVGSVTIGDTTAVTITDNLANMYWEVSALVTCRTVGALGIGGAQSSFDHQTAAQGAPTRWAMANTAAVAMDTTASLALDVTAQWGTSDAANTIRSHNAVVEALA